MSQLLPHRTITHSLNNYLSIIQVSGTVLSARDKTNIVIKISQSLALWHLYFKETYQNKQIITEANK